MPRSPRQLVRLTPSGQISIPKAIRNALQVAAGDIFAVEQQGAAVVFRPQQLSDRDGRDAYLEAKAEDAAGKKRTAHATIAEGKRAVKAAAKKRRSR